MTGKTMIKPAAKLMAKVMAEDKVSKEIDDSLSNNTVHCTITVKIKNIKLQLLI
jgi:hypothetical protein